MEQRIAAANIQPDILLRMEGTPSRALVEIVHTHEPELTVSEYSEANDFPLLLFFINKAEHLDERILAPILEPQNIDKCACPPCQWCKSENVRDCDEDHRFCEQCGECVTDLRGIAGGYGDHGHCRYCKELLEGKENRYRHHYCCWVRRKHNLPPCPEGEHRHCRQCGELIKETRMGDFWETCYSCYQKGKREDAIAVTG